jgi:hypothetical protein
MRETEFKTVIFWLVFCAIFTGMNLVLVIYATTIFIRLVNLVLLAICIGGVYSYIKSLIQLYKEEK